MLSNWIFNITKIHVTAHLTQKKKLSTHSIWSSIFPEVLLEVPLFPAQNLQIRNINSIGNDSKWQPKQYLFTQIRMIISKANIKCSQPAPHKQLARYRKFTDQLLSNTGNNTIIHTPPKKKKKKKKKNPLLFSLFTLMPLVVRFFYKLTYIFSFSSCT